MVDEAIKQAVIKVIEVLQTTPYGYKFTAIQEKTGLPTGTLRTILSGMESQKVLVKLNKEDGVRYALRQGISISLPQKQQKQ